MITLKNRQKNVCVFGVLEFKIGFFFASLATPRPTKRVIPTPRRPTSPGCWVFTPTGCPGQRNWSATTFRRDSWGERHRNAAKDSRACLITRKREYDSWCRARNTIMVFNPNPCLFF